MVAFTSVFLLVLGSTFLPWIAAKDNATNATAPISAADAAQNARQAEASAKQSAAVANAVASHSVDITKSAQSALSRARDAVHGARVDSQGLSDRQKEDLRRAEAKLKTATQAAEYGHLKDAKYGSAEKGTYHSKQLERLEGELGTRRSVSSVRDELRTLRERLAAQRARSSSSTTGSTTGSSVSDDVSAQEMEHQLKDLEELLKQREADTKAGKQVASGGLSEDEIKAELERLRTGIERLEGSQGSQGSQASEPSLQTRLEKLDALSKKIDEEKEAVALKKRIEALKAKGEALPAGSPTLEELETRIRTLRSQRTALEKDLGPLRGQSGSLEYQIGKKHSVARAGADDQEVIDSDWKQDGAGSAGGAGGVDLSKGAFDVDTEMPYGELEPFGREDTAQELTESSIRESDEMVDQLERAEVAEEKRSVFRALTRLRGAAITSFDGVARAQTGNIDEYNKVHKWRVTHPLHHLADEESDISKWAFPDNADFLQMRTGNKK